MTACWINSVRVSIVDIISALINMVCMFSISPLTTFLFDGLKIKVTNKSCDVPVGVVDAHAAARYFIQSRRKKKEAFL